MEGSHPLAADAHRVVRGWWGKPSLGETFRRAPHCAGRPARLHWMCSGRGGASATSTTHHQMGTQAIAPVDIDTRDVRVAALLFTASLLSACFYPSWITTRNLSRQVPPLPPNIPALTLRRAIPDVPPCPAGGAAAVASDQITKQESILAENEGREGSYHSAYCTLYPQHPNKDRKRLSQPRQRTLQPTNSNIPSRQSLVAALPKSLSLSSSCRSHHPLQTTRGVSSPYRPPSRRVLAWSPP